MTDTVKRLGEDGIVVETLDRSELVPVQTPPGLPIPNLQAAPRPGTFW